MVLEPRRNWYLPAALCYFGHPDVERHFYCTGEANGCAAGNVIEEAVLQAFFEIVERDSSAIWWYNQIRRPPVDLGSFDDPFLTRVQERYARLGREFWAIDISSDLGITVIAAVSPRLDGPPADILIGFGAHFNASEAVHRAVTEMNQFLPAVSSRRPDGKTNYVWPDPSAIRFWSVETLEKVNLNSAPTRPERYAAAATFRAWEAATFAAISTLACASQTRKDWRCSCWTSPDPTSNLQSSELSFPTCARFGGAWGPAVSMKFRSSSVGYRSRAPRPT